MSYLHRSSGAFACSYVCRYDVWASYGWANHANAHAHGKRCVRLIIIVDLSAVSSRPLALPADTAARDS